ncbi:MAG TPA: hypothetical protein VGB08_06165 [Allosphingosinicella sp.]|jgi:hypothetical protein
MLPFLVRSALLACLPLAITAPLRAQTPEQVQDLGPEDGELSLEYVGQFAGHNASEDGRQHSGESYYALSDRLVIGGETQLSHRAGPAIARAGWFFDYDSAIVMVRSGDPEKQPFTSGLWLQAALDADGEVARLEARFIAERRTDRWRLQGNAMVRRVNEEDEEGAYFAYSGRASYAVAPSVWVGAEASGQAFRIAGFRSEPFVAGHFAGPSARVEFDLLGLDAQVGGSYLFRLDDAPPGEGLRDTLQLSGGIRIPL